MTADLLGQVRPDDDKPGNLGVKSEDYLIQSATLSATLQKWFTVICKRSCTYSSHPAYFTIDILPCLISNTLINLFSIW